MISAPCEKPCTHILVPDIMPGLELTVGLSNLSEEPLLVGHIRLNRFCN